MFNGMERTGPYAALYFVALMTFGNYVLFNLLVAILVEGFSQEVPSKPLLLLSGLTSNFVLRTNKREFRTIYQTIPK